MFMLSMSPLFFTIGSENFVEWKGWLPFAFGLQRFLWESTTFGASANVVIMMHPFVATGRQRHAAGEVVNYMSVDAYRIGEFLYWLHFTWTTALQICIALVILAYAVGWATLAGLAVILISMAVNMPLARSQNKYQTELMTSRDASIRATTEALRNMKILKLQVSYSEIWMLVTWYWASCASSLWVECEVKLLVIWASCSCSGQNFSL